MILPNKLISFKDCILAKTIYIISIYSRSIKQIFIAIDKLSSYDEKAAHIINEHKVLQLSKDKLLFVKNWKSDK